MAKKIQLSIPEPCHENWDAMSQSEKGRFCGSCQKQVIDFSTMSDRQVAEFFKKPTTGSVCGRFMSDQLEREIDIPKKRIPWFKYFFTIALPAFLFSIKGSAQRSAAKAKTNVVRSKTFPSPSIITGDIDVSIEPVDTIVMPEVVVLAQVPFRSTQSLLNIRELLSKANLCFNSKPSLKETTLDITKGRDLSIPTLVNLSNGLIGSVGNIQITRIDNKRTISGTVTDEKGDEVPGATIVIKGTKSGVPTDNNGNFRILAKTGDVVLATALGYEPSEVTVGAGNTVSLTIRSISTPGEEVVVWAGGVSVSYDPPKKIKPKKEIVEEIITGKVLNEEGNAVPGATVSVKGGKIKVLANQTGQFRIEAKAKDQLIFSSAGYEAKLVGVKDQKDITVTLHAMTRCGVSTVKAKNKKELKNVPLIQEIKKTEATFKIFPNPVEAGTPLNIELQKTEEGYHTIELLNQSGQSVHQQELWIAAGTKQLSITIPETTAGNYFIVMTNKKTGKKSTEKIIIQ